MSADDGTFAAGWKPKAGDRVEGRITSLDIRHGEYEPYPIVTITNGEEAVAIHAFHTVLKNELSKRRPQIGDRLIVTYHGMRATNSGSKYHAYALETPDRPPPPFKWGAFSGADAYEEEPDPEPDEPEAEDDEDPPF